MNCDNKLSKLSNSIGIVLKVQTVTKSVNIIRFILNMWDEPCTSDQKFALHQVKPAMFAIKETVSLKKFLD